MPTLHSLGLFVLAGLALNITPGPDMMYVAARGAGEGRSEGIVSALGIGAGTLVHIALVAAGLATVLVAVPIAFITLRLGGAAYLVYLGIRALVAKKTVAASPPVPASLAVIFRQGVLTNVMNPKVVLFFLAFLPQFVDPSRGSAALQVVELGLLFNISGTTVNFMVAVASSRAAARFRGAVAHGGMLQRLTGIIFIGLGARVALAASQ